MRAICGANQQDKHNLGVTMGAKRIFRRTGLGFYHLIIVAIGIVAKLEVSAVVGMVEGLRWGSRCDRVKKLRVSFKGFP
jgi:hypothetical protein